MPLAFSFFSKRPTRSDTQSTEANPSGQETELENNDSKAETADFTPLSPFTPLASKSASPFPPLASDIISVTETDPTQQLPKAPYEARLGIVLPERREPQGLAALVVNQSGPDAPPLNRRPPLQPFPPAKASAEITPSIPVSTSTDWHESPGTSPLESKDSLRSELLHEIEQVKSDLFGAAMGVSALKDRLDGLEHQAAQPAKSTSASLEALQAWATTWLEENLPKAIERALAAQLEKELSAMSSISYFRSPIRRPSDRHTLLSQAPVILSSSTL